MQKLANYGADWLVLGASPSAATTRAAQTSARVVLSFLGGVVAATALPLRRISGTVPISFSAISIPFAAMLLLNDRAAWKAQREEWAAAIMPEESCVLDSYDAECKRPEDGA